MNIIFIGSAKFGCPSLQGLIEAGHKIPLVVTQPDKQKGRGLKLSSTPVKELAGRFNLKVFQPGDINSAESQNCLKDFSPDLFVVIAYGQKLSPEVLAIPKIMPLNVHASILPKYRGAAPINWAIINGEKDTGNTIMKVVSRMDAGPIISQSRVVIEDSDDALSLEEKLSGDARDLLIPAINAIELNNFRLVEQEESLMSVAGKLDNKITRINWNEPALKIHNLVRGCVNWTAAFTIYKGKIIKLYKTRLPGEIQLNQAVPGEITAVSEAGIVVAAGNGFLSLQELQLEGKKKQPVWEFLNGNKVLPGEKFG